MKSKRDCLGYDPTHKPAPSQSTNQTRDSSPSLIVDPQDPESQLTAPSGYTPASTQNLVPSLKSESSPAGSAEQHDQGPSIEPPRSTEPPRLPEEPALPGTAPSDVNSIQRAVNGSSQQPQVNVPSVDPVPQIDSSNKSMSLHSYGLFPFFGVYPAYSLQ